MKNILITGVNSYIGNKFEEWVSQWPDEYRVTKISLRNDDWKAMDWSKFDVVLHVAGIAHNSSDSKLEELYYKVNRDLTVEVAKKAKSEGVSQFIYMSSIIVFGTKVEVIDSNTQSNPDNFYGDSKLQGERGIEGLDSPGFKVAIVRLPMVYGKGSKGNYPRLSKLATITPLFPAYDNKRSMIHIDNLNEFIRLIINSSDKGYFHPQNKEYVKTSALVEEIGKIKNHKIYSVKGFKFIIDKFKTINTFNKLFGDLYYSKELSDYPLNYQVRDFKESIKVTETDE